MATLRRLGSLTLGDEAVELLDDTISVADVPATPITPSSCGKRIVLSTWGSRGDVQPFIGLSLGLQAAGFQVLITCPENHVGFIEKFGLQAAPVTYDFEAFMRDNEGVRKTMATGDVGPMIQAMQEMNKKELPNTLQRQWKAIKEFRPTLIIATHDLLNCLAYSRMLGDVPVMTAQLQVMFPTKHNKSMLGEPCCHFMGWVLLFKLFTRMVTEQKQIVQDQFGQELGEGWGFPDDTYNLLDYMAHPIAPNIVGYSEDFCPKPADLPKDLDANTHFTGFWVVEKAEQQKRLVRQDSKFGGSALNSLQQFIKDGDVPPVYMGWGSMVAVSPEHMTCLAVRSLKHAGLRGIVLGGWAKLKADLIKGQPDEEELLEYVKENVLFVDSAPHEWLFQQCSVTVHHGGSGTTAAALRSGVPTIITPCAFDQFDNAQHVQRSGAGIGLQQFQKVDFKTLGGALLKCAADEQMKARAKELGERLQSQNGMATAVTVVDKFIQEDVVTGKWKQKRAEQIARIKKARQPGCFSFLARICCMPRPFD